MTTFGGQTIPPLFGGGADLIALLPGGGIGAVENYDQGTATTGLPIDAPAGIQAGDTQFVFSNLSDSLGAASTGWTTLTGILNNNQGRIYTRIADETGDDDFFYAAAQFSNGTSIMAVFRTEPGFFLETQANNLQLQETNFDWDINSFGAGLNDTLVFALMSRSGQGIGGAFTVGSNIDIANIIQASGENHGAFNHALWRFWGWEFESTSRAHSAGDLDYTPDRNAAVKTRFARFGLSVIP